MLVFIHIPKNAGKTVVDILKSNFKSGYADFYTPRKGTFISDKEFKELIFCLKKKKKFVLSGHNIRPPKLSFYKELNLKIFTFIRNPLQRAISLYYFEKRRSKKNHLSHKSIVQYIEKRSDYDNAIKNWQCFNLCKEGDFNHAKKVLDNLTTFGLVEKFDKSLIILQEILGKSVFKNIGYIKRNVSKNKKFNLQSLPKKSLKKLYQMNEEDLKLFDYAKRIFNQRLTRIDNLDIKLKKLEILKKKAREKERWFKHVRTLVFFSQKIFKKISKNKNL